MARFVDEYYQRERSIFCHSLWTSEPWATARRLPKIVFFIRVNARPFDNSVAETLLPAYHSPQHPSYLGIFNLAQPPTGAPTIPPIFYGTYQLVAISLF